MMRHLLRTPVFASEESTQRARIFHRVMWLIMATTSVLLGSILIAQPELTSRALVAIAVVDGLGLVLIWVNTTGRTALASWLLVLGLVTLVSVMALQAGGIRSPGVTFYFVFVLMAGVLLGQRAGIFVGTVCAALALGLVALELGGRLPPATVAYGPAALWLLNATYLAVVLILLQLATGAMKNALARAETELDERRIAVRDREQVVSNLAERVKELRLLHAAMRLLQEDRPFDRQVFSDFVALIPAAWQYPECCEARITFADIDERTAGWTTSPWRQSATFSTTLGPGVVEVAYTQERPAAVDGPFLAEERDLIHSLAEILSTYIHRHHTEVRRRSLELQLRQSQKMDALGQMAGGVAHDFNNILTAIGGNAELIADDIPAGHPARASLDDIRSAHARAVDLVRRILTFSRKSDSHKRPVQLAMVVDEAVQLLRVSVPKSVSVHTEHAPDLPLVLADATQIHQIVMNLGTNAAHAMKETGGRLSCAVSLETFATEDDVPLLDLRPGQYVRLDVADTGTGIPADVVERLFEPFFTTKGDAGTGLGLSVVHGIVHEHGGAITVDSRVGTGTTFSVFLPAVDHARP